MVANAATAVARVWSSDFEMTWTAGNEAASQSKAEADGGERESAGIVMGEAKGILSVCVVQGSRTRLCFLHLIRFRSPPCALSFFKGEM